MNKIFGLVASAALVFGMFTACGDDSSSSSWEPSDDEEISSSSGKTKGSSSSEKNKSSSSKKSKSSSSSENTKNSSSSKAKSSSSSINEEQEELVEHLGVCDSSNVDSLAKWELEYMNLEADSMEKKDLWYICQDGMWKNASDIVVDTRDWPAGKDGDSKYGDVHKDECYVYEDGEGWRYGEEADCGLDLPGCTARILGDVGQGSDDKWYKCNSYGWREIQKWIAELGRCSPANNDSLKFNMGTWNVCDGENYEWLGIDNIHMYGVPCTEKEQGTIAKGLDNEDEYYCTEGEWANYTRWSWAVPWSLRMNKDIAYDSIVDSRDKQVYKTVKIGSQTWMAQNLNYADSTKTPSLKGNSWCDHKPEYCKVGGRYYTWAAAIDSVALATAKKNPKTCGNNAEPCKLTESKLRGICPEGWHLPSVEEFDTLLAAVGGEENANENLKSLTGWDTVAVFGNGTDKYGFTALPAGECSYSANAEHSLVCEFNSGYSVGFWSTAEQEPQGKKKSTAALQFRVGVTRDEANGYYSNRRKDEAISIRCLKD